MFSSWLLYWSPDDTFLWPHPLNLGLKVPQNLLFTVKASLKFKVPLLVQTDYAKMQHLDEVWFLNSFFFAQTMGNLCFVVAFFQVRDVLIRLPNVKQKILSLWPKQKILSWAASTVCSTSAVQTCWLIMCQSQLCPLHIHTHNVSSPSQGHGPPLQWLGQGPHPAVSSPSPWWTPTMQYCLGGTCLDMDWATMFTYST